jgi:hypothetical protein
MTIGEVVRKEFMGDNAVQRVTELIAIYELLKLKKVPNVDTLDSSNLDGHPHVYLSPGGVDVLPVSGSEAFDAVVCVLGALKVCYDVSVFII